MIGEIPLSCHNRGTPTSRIPGTHHARWLLTGELVDEPSSPKLTPFLSSSELLYPESGVDMTYSVAYIWLEGTSVDAFPPVLVSESPHSKPLLSPHCLLLCPTAILFPSHCSFLADEIVLYEQERPHRYCISSTAVDTTWMLRNYFRFGLSWREEVEEQLSRERGPFGYWRCTYKGNNLRRVAALVGKSDDRTGESRSCARSKISRGGSAHQPQ
jgi:hypothetical protein